MTFINEMTIRIKEFLVNNYKILFIEAPNTSNIPLLYGIKLNRMAKALKYETVKELIFWSYADLAMAQTDVEMNQEKYGTFNYVIRVTFLKD